MEKTVVLLVGPQGSGKSTWCATQLPDAFRVSQDDQGARHLEIYEDALLRGESPIVIDRINGLKYQRKRYLDLAEKHGYATRIVWLNVDRKECLRRCTERTDHPTLRPEDADKALSTYFRTFQTPSRMEADQLEIIGPAPRYEPVVDLTEVIGNRRHLIVGDIHGCFDELQALLASVDFQPEDDVLISVGDIIDRGPKVREVVSYLRSLPHFYMVLGNHEDKFRRYLRGNPVKVAGGLEQTIESFNDELPEDLLPWLDELPRIVKTPSGYVVHAGFDPEMPPEEQQAQDCIFMRYFGGRTYFDEMNGRPWYDLWPPDQPRVFFGHIPTLEGPNKANVVGLDGGCVFGGELRLFDSRDGKVHTLKAHDTYAISQSGLTDTSLSPAEALRQREEYVINGLLRSDRSDDNQLVIYTYTDACVYQNAWDEITRTARGHIYDLRTGECVAYPFPKFFNLDENPESGADCLPWDQPYEIMEKLDGWLGVLYRHEGEHKIATRGSFHSPGAVWATQELQKHDLSCLPDDVTLCFEIISPEQRIILDYGDERSLIILAGFNRFTGEEYPRSQLEKWSKQTGLPLVSIRAHMSLEDLLRSKRELAMEEGFVIRFHDGRRVKVKTEWYLELSRVLSKLSPITVWEALTYGKVPERYMMEVPEELRPLAERYQAVLEGQYARIQLRIDELAGPLLREHGDDRRALARQLDRRKGELKALKPAVFLLLDQKVEKLDEMIKRLIYPRGNQFVSDEDLFG